MNKNLIITVLLILLIGTFGYFTYQSYRIGEIKEREDLLVAVTFDLFDDKNVTRKEIDTIDVYRLDAGIYPFFYSVVVVLKNGKEFYYEWGDKEKKTLTIQ